KRVKLKGRFVFSTTKVLEIVREVEEANVTKKESKKRRARSISLEIEDDEVEILNSKFSGSGSGCIVVSDRRSSRSHWSGEEAID
ncbi:MAG: hypothetical protein FE78DRAFT_151673, partial [Acidomyces sp. 'richmondensis']